MSLSHVKLYGQYKVDTFSPDGQLRHSTDYFSNTITASGMEFPYEIPFADCFRYLSVGQGTAATDIVGPTYTTGLQTPFPFWQYLDRWHSGACGYSEHQSGVYMYRGWRLPSGDTGEETFDQTYVMKEFCVFPEYPRAFEKVYVEETDSYEYVDLDDGIPRYRGDSGNLTAFSRVVAPSPITGFSGDYAIVSFKLNVLMNTGVKYFQYLITDDDMRTVCDTAPCTGWGRASGAYSQIHHGLMLVIPEDLPQPPANNVIGSSYTPRFGCPLEPSINGKLLQVYLSSDNTQFLLDNVTGGAAKTGSYKPWLSSGRAPSLGLCSYHHAIETQIQHSLNTWEELIEIRKDSSVLPIDTNFRTSTDEGAVVTHYHSQPSYQRAELAHTLDDRTREVRHLFSWPSIINNGELARSLVFAYRPTGEEEPKDYPLVDMLFGADDGSYIPVIDTGKFTFTQTDGNPLYVDQCNALNLYFNVRWSAP